MSYEKLQELAKARPLRMMPILELAEAMLPELLLRPEEWKSVYIDYQPPHLMRIFIQIGCVRINLHYFMPTADVSAAQQLSDAYNENLYHPHAWASAMRIVFGRYMQYMGMATCRGLDAVPPKEGPFEYQAGGCYAMEHPWEWHQVIPYPNEAVMTVMVTVIPPDWDQDVPRSNQPLRPLTPDELEFMFTKFREQYHG